VDTVVTTLLFLLEMIYCVRTLIKRDDVTFDIEQVKMGSRQYMGTFAFVNCQILIRPKLPNIYLDINIEITTIGCRIKSMNKVLFTSFFGAHAFGNPDIRAKMVPTIDKNGKLSLRLEKYEVLTASIVKT